MLRITADAHRDLLSHLVDGLPDEACGLIAGRTEGETTTVDTWYPSPNLSASSRIYTIEPKTHLRADRDAEDRGIELVGVVHSHTHTEPVPSPTDVEQAPDPLWHYVIVSFRLGAPVLRSWRIVDGSVTEEPVEIVEG